MEKELGQDLVIEILSRLPVKSLLRFRSWLQLLTTDDNFINLHQTKTRNTAFIIWDKAHRGEQEKKGDFKYVENVVFLNKSLELKMPFEKSIHDHLYGITNGLLYLTSQDTTSPLYLRNPLTGDHSAITCPTTPIIQHGLRRKVSFGFGYHQVANQYKVVRMISNRSSKDSPFSLSSQVDLYTLGTETWRRLESIPYDIPSNVTFVSGNLNWLATRYVVIPPSLNIILSFSIKDEVFQEIPKPKEVSISRPDFVSIGELDKLLCMYYGVVHDICEVWVMKEYGAPDSWTKKFKIDQSMVHSSSYLVSSPTCYINDGCILRGVDGTFGHRSLILYNPKTNSIKKLGYFFGLSSEVYSYSGSLVSPRIINHFQ